MKRRIWYINRSAIKRMLHKRGMKVGVEFLKSLDELIEIRCQHAEREVVEKIYRKKKKGRLVSRRTSTLFP